MTTRIWRFSDDKLASIHGAIDEVRENCAKVSRSTPQLATISSAFDTLAQGFGDLARDAADARAALAAAETERDRHLARVEKLEDLIAQMALRGTSPIQLQVAPPQMPPPHSPDEPMCAGESSGGAPPGAPPASTTTGSSPT